MRRHGGSWLVLLALLALAPSPVGAHHTPKGYNDQAVGLAICPSGDTDFEGNFNDPRLSGVIRVTDNGVLNITANLANNMPSGSLYDCRLRLTFTGAYDLHGQPGFKEGGLEPPQAVGECTARPQGVCTSTNAQTGWWVTFMDPQRGKVTWGIDIHYQADVCFVVAGVAVDCASFSGYVTVYEPSVPDVTL